MLHLPIRVSSELQSVRLLLWYSSMRKLEISMTLVRRKSASEAGAIIILIAVAIGVLLGMLALTIDIMLASSAKNQVSVVSENAAMAAMDGFISLDQNVPLNQRLDAAITRANSILGANSIVGLGRGSGILGSLELKLSDCGSSTCDGGVGGDVIPGRMFQQAPPSGTCGAELCCEHYPCFRPNKMADTAVSAFQVRTRILTPLRAFFSSVIGSAPLVVEGRGTSMQISRFGYFLLDVSDSIVGDTHKSAWPICRNGDPETQPCYDNFHLTPYYSATRQVLNTAPTQFGFPVGVVTSASCPSGNFNIGCWLYWGVGGTPGLEASRPANLGVWATPPWSLIKRYQNDYTAASSSLTLTDYQGGVATTAQYRIDSYSLDSTGTRRAEPLFSVLDGANGAIQAFSDRQVAGDKAALAAFDTEVFPASATTRVFPLAGGSNHFDDLLKATRTKYQGTGWDNSTNFLRKFLFPRPTLDTPSSTNIALALQRALNDIAADPTSQFAQSFVVLVTDGMSFCDLAGSCDSTYTGWKRVMDEITTDIIPDYAVAGIQLHIIFVGSRLGPHTLNFASQLYPGNCMDAQEIADYGKPVVLGDDCRADPDPNAACQTSMTNALYDRGYFLEPNTYLYNWAAATGGGFFPIRPVDTSPNAAPPGQPARNAAAGVPRLCDIPINAEPGDYQKQMYDPMGRTVQDQVKAAFDAIMRAAPFALFEQLPS